MTKDTKFLIGAFFFTLILIFGLAFFVSGKDKESALLLTPIEGVSASQDNFDLGEVPINGGIITKEYILKNGTGREISLKRVSTSCMCTRAKIVAGGDETKFFGMEMAGDKNALLSLKMSDSSEFKVVVEFDPAAHGPQGVGPFERVVWLNFDSGVRELTFEGTVVE